MKISFYILEKADYAGKLTYACHVINKAFQQGHCVYCHVGDEQKEQQLDSLLWTFSQGSFIPHLRVNQTPSNWQDYPVQITSDTNLTASDPNHVLVNLTEQVPASYSKFQHVVELVCQEDQDKVDGRNRFRFYRDNGHSPTTNNVQ